MSKRKSRGHHQHYARPEMVEQVVPPARIPYPSTDEVEAKLRALGVPDEIVARHVKQLAALRRPRQRWIEKSNRSSADWTLVLTRYRVP